MISLHSRRVVLLFVQEEVISWVRRRSNAFARGKSRFRGVSGREGRWETRIGSFAGLKNVRACTLLETAAESFHVGVKLERFVKVHLCPKGHAATGVLWGA